MPRQVNRIIQKIPKLNGFNYYLVDTNFLVNKYLNPSWVEKDREKENIKKCHEWWKEIIRQIKQKKAMVR